MPHMTQLEAHLLRAAETATEDSDVLNSDAKTWARHAAALAVELEIVARTYVAKHADTAEGEEA